MLRPLLLKLSSSPFCQDLLGSKCGVSMPLASNPRRMARRHEAWGAVRAQYARRPMQAHQRCKHFGDAGRADAPGDIDGQRLAGDRSSTTVRHFNVWSLSQASRTKSFVHA
jgi:hypothetical protein